MPETLQNISLNKIRAREYPVRLAQDDPTLLDLTNSIKSIGLIYPLVVRAAGDTYQIISGHRRFAAVIELQWQTVPCVVRELTPGKRTETTLAENIFRKDMTAVEVAASVKDAIDQELMTVAEMASAMHRSEQWVQRQLVIVTWPVEVLKSIHEGQLSVSAAENLALVHDDEYRRFLLRNAVEQGATARTTAAWLQAYRASEPAPEAIEKEPVSPGESPTPMVPQAPCIACGQIYRTDQLSHVPVCQNCINAIRSAVR